MKNTFNVLLILSICGCKSISSSQARQSSQELEVMQGSTGSTQSARSNFGWMVTPDERFYRAENLSPEEVYPASNPMVKRLQYWVDELDKKLRLKSPIVLANIPKPKIKLLIDEEDAQAYASAYMTCLNKVAYDADKGGNIVKVEGTFSAFYRNGMVEGLDLTCPKVNIKPAELQSYLANHNSRSLDCLFEAKPTSDGKLSVSADANCPTMPALKGNQAAFAIRAMSTNLIIKSALIQGLTEEESLAVIFHELAHYYQGHSAFPEYSYLYSIDTNDSSKPPREESGLSELSKSLRNSLTRRNLLDKTIAYRKSTLPTNLYQKIPGQRIHTFYLPIVAVKVSRMTEASCDKTADNKECLSQLAKVRSIQNSIPDFDKKLTKPGALFGVLEEADKGLFLSFESESFKLLKMVDAKGSIYFLDAYCDNLKIDCSSFSEEEMDLEDFLVAESKKIDTSDKYDYRQDAFLAYSQAQGELTNLARQLDEQNGKLTEIQASVYQQRLGFYNTEQEADSLSLQYLSLMNLNPQAAVSMLFKLNLLPRAAAPITEDEIEDSKKCQAYRDSQWMENGKAMNIPWGELKSDHPDTCFRVWTADQEIKARKYPLPTLSPASKLSPTWAKLQSGLSSQSTQLGLTKKNKSRPRTNTGSREVITKLN